MTTKEKFKVSTPRDRPRFVMAWLCVISPLVVYFLFFQAIGLGYFFPDDLTPADFEYGLTAQSISELPTIHTDRGEELDGTALSKLKMGRFAEELTARERVFISSIAVAVFAIIAALYAFTTIYRNRGAPGALRAFVVAAFFGGLAATFAGNSMRDLVVEWPLGQARFNGVSYGLSQLADGLQVFSRVNSFCVVVAASALVARFYELTIGDGDWDGQAAVYERGHTLREILVVGSILLTLATVATYYYFHYPLSLMTPEYQEAHRRFAEIASVRWGLLYSTVMVTASAPAIAAHLMERQRLAYDLERERKALQAEAALAAAQGLPPAETQEDPPSFITLKSVATAMRAAVAFGAMVAPAAISPILEFFNAATGP